MHGLSVPGRISHPPCSGSRARVGDVGIAREGQAVRLRHSVSDMEAEVLWRAWL